MPSPPTNPGHTTDTSTPVPRSSSRRPDDHAVSPAFEAAHVEWNGAGTCPMSAPMVHDVPGPAHRSAPAPRAVRDASAPRGSLSTISRMPSIVWCANGPGISMPALFTRTSIRPRAARHVATRSSRACGSVSSAGTNTRPTSGNRASSPRSRSSATLALGPCRDGEVAPAPASVAASRRPIPRAAPVSRTARPRSETMRFGGAA